MYTAVIRPIPVYGALVRRKVINTKATISILDKQQKLYCFAITSKKSIPQTSPKMILNISLLDIFHQDYRSTAKKVWQTKEQSCWTRYCLETDGLIDFGSGEQITIPKVKFRQDLFRLYAISN